MSRHHDWGAPEALAALDWPGGLYLDDERPRFVQKCRACGVIRRADRLNNPCPGPSREPPPATP